MGKKKGTIKTPSFCGIYEQNKSAFEIVGFISVITALFLQIPVSDNEHLKYIQALLLLLLIFGVMGLLYIIWRDKFTKIEETRRTVSFSLVYSGVTSLFIIKLLQFALSAYREQLSEYWKYGRTGMYLVMAYYSDRIMEVLARHLGRERFWKVLGEVLSIVLLLAVMDYGRFYANPIISLEDKIISVVGFGLLLVVSILYFVYKKITIKTIICICITYLVLLFLKNKLNINFIHE